RIRAPEPGYRLLPGPGPPERGRRWETPVPHDHPGFPDAVGPAGRTVRRHGRAHAATGPPPGHHVHGGRGTRSAGGARRTPLVLARGPDALRRARHGGGGDRGTAPPWARRTRRGVGELRVRPGDLAPVRRRLRRRFRAPGGRLRGRVLT